MSRRSSSPNGSGRSTRSFDSRDSQHVAKAPRRSAKVQSVALPRCRAAGIRVRHQAPFVAPEDWHEPREVRSGYRIVMRAPGEGFRHFVTVDEVRDRLAEFPSEWLAGLDVMQFASMTRKKRLSPCYGLQWGSAIYLYPIEEGLVEYFSRPPKPAQAIEAKMYGGIWGDPGDGYWTLTWTESTIKDFYLNNVLIHELGHLLDDRNSSSQSRERYAEWFAIRYGYQWSRAGRVNDEETPVIRRHHGS